MRASDKGLVGYAAYLDVLGVREREADQQLAKLLSYQTLGGRVYNGACKGGVPLQ